MEYKIPLFNLNFDEAEEKAVCEVLRSKWISTGPKCEEFEHLFAEMLNVKYAISVSNCTDALHLACYLLGLGDGDEVICPSLTFVATANAIRYVGAVPVFVDIASCEDLTISPEAIELAITSKTRAIMVMHYAGYSCEMDAIMNIAQKYNLRVIEDACHGPLSEYKGKKLGTIGDMGCFSFFSNKNISTGEGGMVVTNNAELAEKVRLYRSHGMTTMSYQRAQGHATQYDVVGLGFNYRMDDIRAAIGIAQLHKIQQDLAQRQKVREQYLKQLSDISEIYVPFKDNQYFSSNYILPIVLKQSTQQYRNEIRNRIHACGVQTSNHYPAVHRFSAFCSAVSLPLTEYVSDNELTLPMYAALTDTQITYVVDVLKSAINQ